jgi:hypothetical protein
MTSREAKSLLEQLEAAKGSLPAYDTKGVKAVTDEIGRIADDLHSGLEAMKAAAAARASRKGASDAGGGFDDEDDEDGGDGDGDDGGDRDNGRMALRVMRATIARDKRCLLAYAMHRADRVELLRWMGGPVLSAEQKARLSSEEVDHFKRELLPRSAAQCGVPARAGLRRARAGGSGRRARRGAPRSAWHSLTHALPAPTHQSPSPARRSLPFLRQATANCC